MNSFRAFLAVLVLPALIAAQGVLAQGYAVNAQISSQPAGSGTFNYDITLNNTASAGQSISTFWFAWTASGYDLLPRTPTVTGLPGGWNASVLGGTYYYYGYPYYDGYSIEFTTSLAPLAPGHSLDFQFNSPDAPAALMAGSPYYPGIPATTSFVYSGGAFSDAGSQFVVNAVPEPSSAGLLALGAAAGLGLAARREWLKIFHRTTSAAAFPPPNAVKAKPRRISGLDVLTSCDASPLRKDELRGSPTSPASQGLV